MRKIFFVLLLMCGMAAAQTQPVVLQVSTLFDGKGHVLHNTRIVVQDGKIARIDPKAGPVTYDLSGLTVMPGWIDTHTHLDWHFGPDGKLAHGKEDPGEAWKAIDENA